MGSISSKHTSRNRGFATGTRRESTNSLQDDLPLRLSSFSVERQSIVRKEIQIARQLIAKISTLLRARDKEAFISDLSEEAEGRRAILRCAFVDLGNSITNLCRDKPIKTYFDALLIHPQVRYNIRSISFLRNALSHQRFGRSHCARMLSHAQALPSATLVLLMLEDESRLRYSKFILLLRRQGKERMGKSSAWSSVFRKYFLILDLVSCKVIMENNILNFALRLLFY
jgi:hypothetical protein